MITAGDLPSDDQDSGTTRVTAGAGAPRAVLAAFAAAGFVVFAVVLEVLSGAWANSTVPSWAEWLVPLAWPQPLRVAWWLAVAGAAGLFHRALRRAGIRRRPVMGVITVVPFLVFAAGVAAGVDWATWH
jgi:hypothetical protein